MNSNRKYNSIRNILSGFLNRLVGLGIPFILRTILIELLGSQYLGLSNLFTSLLQVLNLAELGFGTAITYSMYEPIANNDEISICALLNLYKKIYRIIGIIILVLGLLITPFLKYFIKGSYPMDINIYIIFIIYLINTVASFMLFSYKRCILEADQKSYIMNNINTKVQFLLNIIKIILLILFKNYYIYVIFFPIITIIDNIAVSIIIDKKYPNYYCKGNLNKEKLREIYKKVFALLIQKIGNAISNSLDNIIVSSFIGLSVLAIFSNYQYISNSVLNIVIMCYGTLTASVGNSIVKENLEKNKNLFNNLVFINAWIGCWCAACLLTLFQPFMKIWVGKELMFNMDTVIIFVFYFLVCQTRKIITVYKDACGIWWEDKFRPLVGCFINLFLNIILVKKIGINGVLLSTIFTYLFIEFPWEVIVLYKYYFKSSSRQYFKNSLQYFFITIFISFITYKISNVIYVEGILGLLIKSIICIFIPNIIFIILYWNSKKMKDVLIMFRLKDKFIKN